MRSNPKRKNSQIQNHPRRRKILLLQRKMQKEIQTKQKQICRQITSFFSSQFWVLLQRFCNKPQQLITKQYSSNIGRPQNYRPISWDIMPQISPSCKQLHKNHRSQATNRQENLFLNTAIVALTFSVKHQNSPCSQKSKKQHKPVRIKVKYQLHTQKTETKYKNFRNPNSQKNTTREPLSKTDTQSNKTGTVG